MPSTTCPVQAALPRRAAGDAAQAWLQDWLRREGVTADDLLPTPLRLRKEVERLTGSVHELPSEQQVREIAAELNRQIIQWRRIPEGPPVYLRLVDADALVARWRATRPPAPPAPPMAQEDSARPRWRWRRRKHEGR